MARNIFQPNTHHLLLSQLAEVQKTLDFAHPAAPTCLRETSDHMKLKATKRREAPGEMGMHMCLWYGQQQHEGNEENISNRFAFIQPEDWITEICDFLNPLKPKLITKIYLTLRMISASEHLKQDYIVNINNQKFQKDTLCAPTFFFNSTLIALASFRYTAFPQSRSLSEVNWWNFHFLKAHCASSYSCRVQGTRRAKTENTVASSLNHHMK